MDTMTTLRQWQDGYIGWMKRVERPVVRYVGKVAEPMARSLPDRPRFLATMPMVRDVVQQHLTFRRRVVDEQAAFVRSMMKAMDPVLAKMDAVPQVVATKGATTQHEPHRMPQRKVAHKAA